MSKPAAIPEISAAFDMDEGCWRIYATAYHSTMPAGERLLRGHPHPDVRWSHADQASAEKDAATLRQYLADAASGKRKDVEPQRRGWWE